MQLITEFNIQKHYARKSCRLRVYPESRRGRPLCVFALVDNAANVNDIRVWVQTQYRNRETCMTSASVSHAQYLFGPTNDGIDEKLCKPNNWWPSTSKIRQFYMWYSSQLVKSCVALVKFLAFICFTRAKPLLCRFGSIVSNPVLTNINWDVWMTWRWWRCDGFLHWPFTEFNAISWRKSVSHVSDMCGMFYQLPWNIPGH
jgi:hypothetical protein